MSARAIHNADHESWPVIWRVVAPGAGSYNHDMVFLETDREREARSFLTELRAGGYAVRLERVQCGPLPAGAAGALSDLRSLNPQNPGAERTVLGCWEKQPRQGRITLASAKPANVVAGGAA